MPTERRAAAVAATLLLVLTAARCSSSTFSEDADANYKWVYGSMSQPRPEIVHSRVERISRCCFLRTISGNWEFEVYASRSWVDAVRESFKQIEWEDERTRDLPPWFDPPRAQFTVWQLQGPSVPIAHLFVEREPQDESRVHVFLRRH